MTSARIGQPLPKKPKSTQPIKNPVSSAIALMTVHTAKPVRLRGFVRIAAPAPVLVVQNAVFAVNVLPYVRTIDRKSVRSKQSRHMSATAARILINAHR